MNSVNQKPLSYVYANESRTFQVMEPCQKIADLEVLDTKSLHDEQSFQKLDLWIRTHIAEQQKIAYALTNEDLTILASNPTMNSWIVGEQGGLVDQSLCDVFPELAGWAENILELLLQNQSEMLTIPKIQRILPDNSERYFDLKIEPLVEFGNVLLVLLIDVTEQARLHQQLQQERNELHLNIVERKRAEKAKEKLIEELDAFAHTVAHDLQNPLAHIIGYADLLNDTSIELPAETLETGLQAISRGARKMSEIINELLLLAKVHNADVKIELLDMTSIVAEALDRLSDIVEEQQVEIILPTSWPMVFGYAPWVEEVWANYLGNGIKYGGQPARLELGATVQADGMVRFWVDDNGFGLSPEDQGCLFTQFTRLDQHSNIEGNGLGLSIVQRIVNKLGGQVGVESELGKGSTFSFTLPQIHPPK